MASSCCRCSRVAHEINVTWQTDVRPASSRDPSLVALGAPASNVTTTINLPETRWILFAAGGGVGPAVLYWAEFIVFIVLAVLLGRFTASPLGTATGCWSGSGSARFPGRCCCSFAAWVFAMQWRSAGRPTCSPGCSTLVQVGLVVLTLVALGSLVAAIPNGLLGTPDMRIAGAGSASHLLTWFHDRIEKCCRSPPSSRYRSGFTRRPCLPGPCG